MSGGWSNRALLRAQGLPALLPKVSDFIVGVDDAPRVDRAVACENTYAPSRTDGRSILMVHGLSMRDEGAPLKSTGVVAGFSHVYGSTASLYLASTETADQLKPQSESLVEATKEFPPKVPGLVKNPMEVGKKTKQVKTNVKAVGELPGQCDGLRVEATGITTDISNTFTQ